MCVLHYFSEILYMLSSECMSTPPAFECIYYNNSTKCEHTIKWHFYIIYDFISSRIICLMEILCKIIEINRVHSAYQPYLQIRYMEHRIQRNNSRERESGGCIWASASLREKISTRCISSSSVFDFAIHIYFCIQIGIVYATCQQWYFVIIGYC